MKKTVDKKQMRTMNRILIGLLVVGLLISFIAVVNYIFPDRFLSYDQGEKKIRSCFAEVTEILESHGIDMTTANIEEGHLLSDDEFEMMVTIDMDEDLQLDVRIYQVGRQPCYKVTLYRYGEVNDTADFIDLADYPYVYEVAAYLGDCYSSGNLLKAAQKQQRAAITRWEEEGPEVYEYKWYKRFFVHMEEIGFAYVCEADEPPAYQYVTIDDYMRA